MTTRPAAPPGARGALQAALVGVAVVWGLTFPMVKDAVAEVPPFEFLGIRFVIAAGLISVVAAPVLRRMRRREVVLGAAAGAVLFGGYAFQTVGLQYTTASNTGLITGLYVVITPLLSAVLLRRAPAAWALAGATVATAGLVLLAMNEGPLRLRRGDVLVLACAVSFALHIVLLGRLARELPPLGLAALQMWTVALLASAATVAVEPVVLPRARAVWAAVAVTAVLASAAAYFVQTLAQRYVAPTRVAVILASEAAFAALFGVLLLGERLRAVGWAGAALMLAGILAAEAGPGRASEG